MSLATFKNRERERGIGKRWGVLSPFATYLIKNRQNLNRWRLRSTPTLYPFAAQVSLSLNFVSMLWSNSITFSINSFSFGLGIIAFFPFYHLEKTNTIEFFFFFFSYYFLCLWLFLCIPLSKFKRSLCLFDGAKGFFIFPWSWVLA